MQKKVVILVLMVLGFAVLSTLEASAESTSLFNDTGATAYGLRVTFDRPVKIVRMGERFTEWTIEDGGSTILFQDGEIPPWGDFYFFWEPAEATLISRAWLLVPPTPGELVPEIPREEPIVLPTDEDGDTLSNSRENSTGTDYQKWDTDGDTLGDYEELIKYRTKPTEADSDGDGIPDGDWNERRENAYTVEITIKLREPFDIKTMNSYYQDARIISGPDGEGYTLISVIIYPDTIVNLDDSSYPLDELPPELKEYTTPGTATNYDSGMQKAVHEIVEGAQTDVEAVLRILTWVRRETEFYDPDRSIPEVYYTYIADGQVRLRSRSMTLTSIDGVPMEELLRTHYFAKSMFDARVHGTCTSIATLKCAMIKAAGIPCRLCFGLYPFYYHEGQQPSFYNNLTHREWNTGWLSFSEGERAMSANHAFLEAWLGSRWMLVDRSVYSSLPWKRKLLMQVFSVPDWSEVDLSQTYPTFDWIDNRPYYTLSISDSEPEH